MDLSVILVNWNSTAYLRECLTSIYEHTRDLAFEIIVVDNNSSETDVETLLDIFPQVVLLKSTKNLGFAGANNLGCRHARGEFVILLNPDTRLIEDSLNILLRHIRSIPDAGIVGCKLLNTDLSIQVSCIKRSPTILNQIMQVEFLQVQWPRCPLWGLGPLFETGVQAVPVDVIPGACMLLRRAVFERVGMLSEEYFMYAEDLDLNFTVRRAGYQNYYVGETAIIHHGGGSSSSRDAGTWATLMQCRAMVKYFRKTRGPLYQRLYQTAMGCAACARLALLLFVSLLGNRIWDRSSRLRSWNKWMAVLQWALGIRTLTAQ